MGIQVKSKIQHQINGGVYLVVNPAEGIDTVFPKVKAALAGGIDVLQIWNHWQEHQDQKAFIDTIIVVAHEYNVPVFINEEWQWLKNTMLDGVHFDSVPLNWASIQREIDRPFLTGITCGNDAERIQWGIDYADYLSFCSMFPSASAGTCEIVRPEVVRETRQKTSAPIFVSGGITPDLIKDLLPLGINGVAVISAILKADDPTQATRHFKLELKSK